MLAAVAVTAVAVCLSTVVRPGASAQVGSTAWPTFHGDSAHTGTSSDTAIGSSSAPGLTVAWKTPVVAAISDSPAVAFNATLGKNMVYVGGGAMMYGIDATTGHIVWKYKLGGGSHSSPTVSGNTVYFGAGDSYLYALDAATGALQCRFFTTGKISASPLVSTVDSTGPVVFIGDQGASEKLNAGHEWAINGVGNTAGDCTQRWVFNGWFNKGPHGTNTGSWSSPAIATDTSGRPLVVFGSSNPDDAVYALDARDGSLVWHFQTQITSGDEDVGAPPTIGAPGLNGLADGAVYVAGKDTIMYALDLLTGAELWEFDMQANAGVKQNCVSDPALMAGALVMSYDTYIYKFNAATGALKWRSAAAPGIFYSSPVISGGPGNAAVFSGDLSGVEHAYSLANGSPLFALTTGGMVLSSAAVANDTLYFGSGDHFLYALR
jgi:outer membrane protein assembly factor BamB